MSDIKYYHLVKKIGEGHSSDVYKAYKNNETYAIKIINIEYALEKNLSKNIEKEIELLSSMNHPNILKYIETLRDDEKIYIITEYVGCDLYTRIKSVGRLENEEAAEYIYFISNALEYLHANGIIHRDVKTENILLGKNNKKVVLCDFGWATDNKIDLNVICGTPYYLCPEMLLGNLYDHKCDIWCLGILMYEILTDSLPFDGRTDDDLYYSILQDDLVFPDYVAEDATELISVLLFRESSCRPEAEEIREFKWIDKYYLNKAV